MFSQELQHKIDTKTKPPGSLGQLERIAFKVARIQQSLSPALCLPHIVVFAGDHGISQEKVSAYPVEVTGQMVLNFLSGGAAINVFCHQNEIELLIVDAGVNRDLPGHISLVDHKIGKSTRNFLEMPAMTPEQRVTCFARSQNLVDIIHNKGCNVIGFGEMGIGNTSSASMIMHYLTGLPLEECIGNGTGINPDQLAHKKYILSKARRLYGNITDPLLVLETFGGFETAQMTGAMLAAFEQNMLLLIDGFIASSALLVAQKIKPAILQNCIFCHESAEYGHQFLLRYFHAEPILHLDLRLGEGTGCALAYPIIKSAVCFLNNMSSFTSAGVTHRQDTPAVNSNTPSNS